jgi:hypothetical protein
MWIKDAEYARREAEKQGYHQAHQIDGVQARPYACRAAS